MHNLIQRIARLESREELSRIERGRLRIPMTGALRTLSHAQLEVLIAFCGAAPNHRVLTEDELQIRNVFSKTIQLHCKGWGLHPPKRLPARWYLESALLVALEESLSPDCRALADSAVDTMIEGEAVSPAQAAAKAAYEKECDRLVAIWRFGMQKDHSAPAESTTEVKCA